MSGDLKQELMVCLAEVYKEDGCTHTVLHWKSPEEQSKLRARLERATVTEPGECDYAERVLPIQPELCERLRSLGKTVGAPGYWAGWADRIEKATITEHAPTDAPLLADLRRELGEGWKCEDLNEGDAFTVVGPNPLGLFGWPRYAALRTHGPAKIAAALKLLAGVAE